MKPGKPIILVGADGRARDAVVHAVTGSGPSGWKLLDVADGGAVLEKVPHAKDAAEGAVYWLEVGERIVRAVTKLARAVRGARAPRKRTRKKK